MHRDTHTWNRNGNLAPDKGGHRSREREREDNSLDGRRKGEGEMNQDETKEVARLLRGMMGTTTLSLRRTRPEARLGRKRDGTLSGGGYVKKQDRPARPP